MVRPLAARLLVDHLLARRLLVHQLLDSSYHSRHSSLVRSTGYFAGCFVGSDLHSIGWVGCCPGCCPGSTDYPAVLAADFLVGLAAFADLAGPADFVAFVVGFPAFVVGCLAFAVLVAGFLAFVVPVAGFLAFAVPVVLAALRRRFSSPSLSDRDNFAGGHPPADIFEI